MQWVWIFRLCLDSMKEPFTTDSINLNRILRMYKIEIKKVNGEVLKFGNPFFCDSF